MKFLWALSASFLLCAVGVAQCPPMARLSYPTMGYGTITPGILRANSVVGIKDTPFSAAALYKIEQVTPDGKRIHEEVHGKVFRDSQGRMRWEQEFIRNGQILRTAVVQDPVEGRMIELDENTRTACISAFWRAPDSNLLTSRLPVDGSDTEEELGSIEIEGFIASGTRQTRRFPEGARGYAQPLVGMTELWFSPDLKMTLVSKEESPRVKYIGKLVHPRAEEPDPSLFRLPADYKIIDERQQSK